MKFVALLVMIALPTHAHPSRHTTASGIVDLGCILYNFLVMIDACNKHEYHTADFNLWHLIMDLEVGPCYYYLALFCYFLTHPCQNRSV